MIQAPQAGLENDPAVRSQIARATDQALQNALLSREIGPTVTDDAIKARYDRDCASKPGEEEVHAAHILVDERGQGQGDHRAAARPARTSRTLAKENSTDPAPRNGGDLGFFKKADMLPEFSDAAFALKPGEVTPDAGARPASAGTSSRCWSAAPRRRRRFEQVRDEMRQQLIQEGVSRCWPRPRPGCGREVQPGRHADDRPAAAAAPDAAAAPPPAAATPAGQGAAWPCRSRRSPSRCRSCRRSPASASAPAQAGIRYQGRTDLVMIELPPGTTVAGVFTRNKCPGAPIDWCRDGAGGRPGPRRGGQRRQRQRVHRPRRARRGAGHRRGRRRAARLRRHEVFLASTGVIGEVLPHERITAALPALHASAAPDAWEAAARGIMTTDTFPKAATRTAEIGGTAVRITGIAKGSGMIAPDMATMLCFVFTDAASPPPCCRTCWPRRRSAASTAPRWTATPPPATRCCCSPPARPARRPRTPTWRAFRDALDAVLLDLALQVVRDGEGAQKLIRIDVTGAVSTKSAKRVAMAVANSPLVKTAIAGEDANWGRIVMAVGKAGEPADRDRCPSASAAPGWRATARWCRATTRRRWWRT